MRALPLTIGTIHFVGIGGIGMSGIAEVLKTLGYAVQGSDLADNANVKRLRELGIPVEVGHRAENLGSAAVVVVSSAVKRDNPELVAARAAHLPVVRRAEMLGELMRLKWSIAIGGTHGKTTTTSMVAALLDGAGLDPTVINGGIINAYGTNARLGAGEWMVVEADESDGTFVKLPATIALVTNIDPEHMDFYGSFDAVRAAFRNFIENIPFYGFAALCLDHPEVQAMIPKVSDRRIVTYGFSPQADIRALNVELGRGGAGFDVAIEDRGGGPTRLLEGFTLPMFGLHNVQNALGALALGLEMGLDPEAMRGSLARFTGVKRRFTRTGEANGITVIDDYGHHPVEIAAVLKAARTAGQGRTIAVVQPHRYSRLASLFEEFCTCFNDADVVVVADVYAAGESPLDGIHRDALVDGLRMHGHRQVVPLDRPEALADLVADLARPGDFVVCLGAGSISAWAYALPGELEARFGPASAILAAQSTKGAA
ncbi:MAG: UDP-N-acetylmuramate--L-alanine ligase [Azospirillum sp.]|nr:UDP-N-acetylmuramate--L-alanine ligase [Azospirillum sp.]